MEKSEIIDSRNENIQQLFEDTVAILSNCPCPDIAMKQLAQTIILTRDSYKSHVNFSADSLLARRLGMNLKKHRTLHRMSQDSLGAELGITKSTISNYERGKLQIPISYIPLLGSILGDDFFYETISILWCIYKEMY